jgi:hypothetical protein
MSTATTWPPTGDDVATDLLFLVDDDVAAVDLLRGVNHRDVLVFHPAAVLFHLGAELLLRLADRIAHGHAPLNAKSPPLLEGGLEANVCDVQFVAGRDVSMTLASTRTNLTKRR